MGSRALVLSSMSSISGSTARARAMHRRCCWPPERPRALFLRRSFTSSQMAASRRERSTISSSFARFAHAVGARAVGDVVVYAHGEGVGLLEHHAYLAAQARDVHVLAVDVLAVIAAPRRSMLHAGHQVVHAVERLEEGALAAAGGAYEGGYLVFAGICMEMSFRAWIVAVVEVQRPAFYYGFVAHFGPPCSQRFLSFLPASFAAMLMTKAIDQQHNGHGKGARRSPRVPWRSCRVRR